MSSIERKEQFDNTMIEIDEKIKLIPEISLKYIGITMPFPQSIESINKVIKAIKLLKERDGDVCIAVKYVEKEQYIKKYTEVVYIGNDYPHLMEIAEFMKLQEIEISIKDTCILFREVTDDLNKSLIGYHQRITSINDLFSRAEIQLESMNVGEGYGYEYENKQVNNDIISYCACNKEGDEEGKVLGYQLFKKSFEYYSKLLLTEGVILGYPIADSKINLINSSCSMCFYRDYYYIMGAKGALVNALSEASWRICEPVIKVDLICSKFYFEKSSTLRKIESINIFYDKEKCKVLFKSKLSEIISNIGEFYNNREVYNCSIKIDGYASVGENINFDTNFKIITDINEFEESLK